LPSAKHHLRADLIWKRSNASIGTKVTRLVEENHGLSNERKMSRVVHCP